MSVIWKFPVPVEGEFSIEMPMGADLLCVQTQKGDPFIWAEVNPLRDKVVKSFRLFGTGQPREPGDEFLSYVGTFQIRDGDLVFHLYERDNFEDVPF